MYSLAGRLPPDIAPIELQRKGIYRFIRDNLPDAESHSRAFIAIGANAVGINQGKR
jgi:hypothetical protein